MSLRRSTEPLYRRMAGDLEGRIASGELARDTQLPSEAELAQQYGVHRMTVRQALSELARTGLIRTVHGRGSFVAAPPVPYDVTPGKTASLTRLLEEQGLRSTQRLLGQRQEAPHDIRALFDTASPLIGYEQLRLVDDEPWSLTTTWLDANRFPMLDAHWDGAGSLYQVLADSFGVVMRRVAVTFSAELAQPDEARLLHVSPGAPLLISRGRNAASDGTLVAVAEHRFRGDRVRFTVGLED